jgi:two-component system nitrate/nitrite response regulator NarL
MPPIRIVLADDHRIVLEGLAQLLSLEPDFDVLQRCIDGTEALEVVERVQPDVLVADVKMPGLTGMEVLERLREEGSATRVVLLTAHMTDAQVVDAVRLNVGGIVLKEAASRTLVQCVRTVAEGGRWLDPATVHGALEAMQRREAGIATASKTLTKRELEIVRMVATGLRNKQIGDKLAISEGTVKMHLHSIYEKLGISGRVELSNYARENELV